MSNSAKKWLVARFLPGSRFMLAALVLSLTLHSEPSLSPRVVQLQSQMTRRTVSHGLIAVGVGLPLTFGFGLPALAWTAGAFAALVDSSQVGAADRWGFAMWNEVWDPSKLLPVFFVCLGVGVTIAVVATALAIISQLRHPHLSDELKAAERSQTDIIPRTRLDLAPAQMSYAFSF